MFHVRLLYWGEGLGIFVAAMDGTGQRVLHTGYHGGSGLSLDMKGKLDIHPNLSALSSDQTTFLYIGTIYKCITIQC